MEHEELLVERERHARVVERGHEHAHEVSGGGTGDTSDPAEAVSVLLDSVAGLLHAVGRYALDTETLSQHQAQVLMDRWRRHVTVGLDRKPKPRGQSREAIVYDLESRDEGKTFLVKGALPDGTC